MYDSSFIKLTSTETLGGAVMLSIMLLVILSQTTQLLAWLDGRKISVSAHDEEDFAILLIIADLLVGYATFPGNLLILYNRGFARYGTVLCDYNSIEIYFTHTFSVMCAMLYSIGTYQHFVHGSKAPFWKNMLAAVFIACTLLLIPLIPYLVGAHYHHSQSKLSQKGPVWLAMIQVTIAVL
jgi:hypothetical protein